MKQDQNILPLRKRCFSCKERKPLTEFHRSSEFLDGRQYECKECACARRRARYPQENIKRVGVEEASRLAEIRVKKSKLKKGYKLCARCLAVKKLDQFSPDKKVSDGHGSYCKPCNVSWTKEYRAKSPAHRLVMSLNTSRQTAARKGLPHELTISDLVKMWNDQDGRCAYTGVQMKYDGAGSPESVSLDRVDSSKGYTKDNVVLCGVLINRMKNDQPVEAFLRWCELAVSHHKAGSTNDKQEIEHE
jgi:hypothetical protein